MPRLFVLTSSLCLLATLASAQDIPTQTPTQTTQPPVLRDVRVSGNKELSDREVRDTMRVRVGDAFDVTAEAAAEATERAYREKGYAFARVKGSFDATSGVLSLTIDEGVIDDVEFEGIGAKLARTFKADFALRAGDVFNRPKARQALDALLRPTRGAVSRDRSGGRRGAFDLIDRNGQRVLVVSLREPPGRFKLSPNLGDREDWFTSVDGFVPSLGFGAAIFDHETFNHAYVAGHFSVKTASGDVGYALGVEKPFFARTKLFVGGEVHDLTASDDQWQISSSEASLAAVGPRLSFRDYYRRRGVQVAGAVRVHPKLELMLAWRGERHEALAVESDFSIWNDDDAFRPNIVAQEGRLNAVILGATFDSPGFEQETLQATYRRHQLETPFGGWLTDADRGKDRWPSWRLDWTSEITNPQALHSDFDYARHIVSGRVRVLATPHQEIALRAIGGWSSGSLPPQRQFGIGGIGSVHGYEFKESVGDRLQLYNLEYALGWPHAFQILGFVDGGRVDRRDVPGPWLKGIGWGFGLSDMRIEFGYKLDDVPSSLQVLVRFGRTF